ncbi:MAG: NRDE family protein [Cytophagales bacterium]|nr:NRDE family protein [Cytophagales bacterium]
MCLIAFALNEHPDYPLILVANRDEFYERPTSYADFWEDHPNVLGGRDLKGGGTWMGVTRAGRITAVTNYRDPQNISATAKTRGDLTKDYLISDTPALPYLEQVEKEAALYNGFNLLLFEAGKGYYFSNYGDKIRTLDKGVFGLSNALLDTPWPKLEKLKENFSQSIQSNIDVDSLLELLTDDQKASDEALPETGVPYEWEKALSSICIATPTYGTCCSTVILVDKSGNLSFTEKSFPVGARDAQSSSFNIKIADQ